MSILTQGPGAALLRLGRRIAHSLLPASCLLCGADSDDAAVCSACTADLSPLSGPGCPQCAEPTTHGERCGRCLATPPAFDATVALYRYEFPADRLVHALKYGHQLAVARWFGQQLATTLTGNACDIVIPLPLHRDRLRERGFNQSAEIGRALAGALGKPQLTGVLHRARATRPQADLALKERAGNVRGAFAATADLAGRRILLVDDVMTSGATLDEAARILKMHGAAAVIAGVVARAVRH